MGPPRKNAIGLRLKLIREAKKVSGRMLAKKIGRGQSYVSKMESGGLYPSLEYIKITAKALNLSNVEQQELLALYKLYETEHEPLSKESDALARRQQAIRELELSSIVFRVFDNFCIPGLLQIEQYAWYVFDDFQQSSIAKIKSAVKKRMERNAILKDRKRRFIFLIMESAFLNRICSFDIMQKQVSHLIKLNKQKNISIGLIPGHCRLPTLPITNFNILDEKLVLADTLIGFITYKSERDIREHFEVFLQFERCAVFDGILQKYLDGILERYRLIEEKE